VQLELRLKVQKKRCFWSKFSKYKYRCGKRDFEKKSSIACGSRCLILQEMTLD